MITKEHGYTCNALAQRILQQSPLWRCYESVSTTIAGGGCTQYGNSGGPPENWIYSSNEYKIPIYIMYVKLILHVLKQFECVMYENLISWENCTDFGPSKFNQSTSWFCVYGRSRKDRWSITRHKICPDAGYVI